MSETGTLLPTSMSTTENSSVLNTNNAANFAVSFVRKPNLNFGVVRVTQPGISVDAAHFFVGTKFHSQPNRHMDPVREQMSVTFNVAEDYSNWFEIVSWIKSYADASVKTEDLVSDIVIFYFDLNKRPVRKTSMINAFPVSVSSVDFATEEDNADPVRFSAMFEMNEIRVEKL